MLINRNMTVGALRTSVRLEPEFWSALIDIAKREKVSIDQLCTVIDAHLGDLGRTAAIRVFIASYFAEEQATRNATQYQPSLMPGTVYQTPSQTPRHALG